MIWIRGIERHFKDYLKICSASHSWCSVHRMPKRSRKSRLSDGRAVEAVIILFAVICLQLRPLVVMFRQIMKAIIQSKEIAKSAVGYTCPSANCVGVMMVSAVAFSSSFLSASQFRHRVVVLSNPSADTAGR